MKTLVKGETLLKMMLPKIVQITFNFAQGGFRIALRSMVHLLRATIVTRILSAITILALDVYSLTKRRISWVQFWRNVALSACLVVFGTIGWNLGAGWFAIEILGGIIGAALVGFTVPAILERIMNKFIKSDATKMMENVNSVACECCPPEPTEAVRKKMKVVFSASKLKLMYASPDRECFARDVLDKEVLEND